MKKRLAGMLFLLCLITGCSKEQEISTYYESSPANTKDLSYEVPISLPKVMVNLESYDVKGKKVVLFYAEDIADTFEILDASTNEVVYTGKIKKNIVAKDKKEASAYGYFTELEKTGTYYIRTDIIGQSYPFEIREDARALLFAESSRESYLKWGKQGEQEEVFFEITSAILAFELYGKVFGDDLGVLESNNGIPDIVDGIKECISIWKIKKPSEYTDTKTAFMAAGIFAKFANIYKQYDAAYAMECTKVAEQIWNYYSNQLSEETSEMYFAAAELYRVTGYERYHSVIIQKESIKEQFYGSVTYLSTRRRVNIQTCNNIMKDFMETAESIYEQKGDGICIELSKTVDEVLLQMEHLAVIDHIVTSHEYMTIIENQLNYLLGCNAQGKNYKEEIKGDSQFLFLLTVIMENELDKEE